MLKKILIADDDSDLLILLNKSLTNAGYEVQCYTEASCIINNTYDRPDLFILDNEMGFIDGLAVCKYLKFSQKDSTIPILFITGNCGLEEMALRVGASYFMTKPLNVNKLITVIQTLIDQAECGKNTTNCIDYESVILRYKLIKGISKIIA